jgi:hypothetical protein
MGMSASTLTTLPSGGTTMKLLLATIALLAVGFQANAQSGARADSESVAGAAAQSISQSGTISDTTSTINQTFNSAGKSTVEYGGSYKLKNTPSVSAPGIITANVCGMGLSGGASGAGFGLSMGGTYIDDSCRLITQAAAINVVAGRTAAITHLARNPEMCSTFRATGQVASNTLCTDAERAAAKAAAKRRAKATAGTASTRSDPSVSFAKCYRNDAGVLTIKYKRNADKTVANAQCVAHIKTM